MQDIVQIAADSWDNIPWVFPGHLNDYVLLARLDYMMHYHDFLSKLFLEETTEIEQWPDTFQSCSQFTASTL